MHPNPAFRGATDAKNLAFARDRGFGTLAVNGTDGPLISHIPFLVSQDGTWIELHLVRSNPILRQLENPVYAVLAVTGPHSYISPDWYGVKDQVPTWNYTAVHLRGKLEQRPPKELQGILERLSAQFEGQLEKPPWLINKMDEGALNRMLRQIVPCRIKVTDVQGTWKLGQNKGDEARLRAADQALDAGLGDSVAELSALMKNPEG